ncbi:MAG: hypothetical protein A2288_01565 [Candidatus Moranbacteria bacterium RIFOXYA12_FULL_44_15]|nr:MAG: hypothetical protein A2288_01565 [Candidatus Moranbacteria bacterium RIFOXYA12_FULL_44_15]
MFKRVVVKNEGYVPSKKTSLRVYTQKGSGSPVLIQERGISRIDPKRRKTLELEIPAGNLPSTPYRLIVQIDPENKIPEENETNNRVVAVVK